MAAEHGQAVHYDTILATYDAHYDDAPSRAYRDRFIDAPLLDGIDWQGKRVLEAMCGSGLTTRALLARGAQVTGLDLSGVAVETFRRRWPSCTAVQASITDSGLPAASVDAVVIVGGLHHLHPHVEAALVEIHRLLVPGGWLCFMEPHAGSLPDVFRRLWYRLDPLFVDNEAAIDLPALRARFADRFTPVRETFGGGPAFLLVANSMVFRMPLWLKPYYTPALLRLEAFLARRPSARMTCFTVCQWQRR